MTIEEGTETAIGVTSFKAKCLAVIDDIFKGKTSRVVLMKHNRPVAAIVPIAGSDRSNSGARCEER